jgi:hypothetical protein
MAKAEISDEEFRILIREIDQNQNGIIELTEYLQVKKKRINLLYLTIFFFCLQLMSAIKTGNISASHFAKAARIDKIKKNPSPERSGGGI